MRSAAANRRVAVRARGAALAGAVLALAGCGSLHPGAVAVVGDTTISEARFEETTDAFCTVIAAINQAQGTPTDNIPVRTAALSALNILVVGEAVDQLAAANGLTLGEAEVDRWMQSLPPVFEDLPEGEADLVDATLERVARNNLLIAKLGEQVAGPDAGPEEVAEAGTRRVLAYLERIGAQTEPRYGEVVDTRQQPGTGSLSVPVSAEAVQGLSAPGSGVTVRDAEACS